MRTILVASDLSPRSERALRRAIRLARDHGAALHVLCVIDDAAPEDVSGPAGAAARARLERFLAAAGEGVTARVEVRAGDPTADIVDTAQSTAPDLVVLGTHRPRRFLDPLRETTAQRVIRHCAAPVLVVRDPDDHPYDRAIAATDFSPGATAAMAMAERLCPGIALRPVHAVHVPYGGLDAPVAMPGDVLQESFLAQARELDAAWRDRMALPPGTAATRLEVSGLPALLRDVLATEGGDLLTCGAHGRAGAARALLGSVAGDLARAPPCDLLIARPAAG